MPNYFAIVGNHSYGVWVMKVPELLLAQERLPNKGIPHVLIYVKSSHNRVHRIAFVRRHYA
jgi:hypothetical protein